MFIRENYINQLCIVGDIQHLTNRTVYQKQHWKKKVQEATPCWLSRFVFGIKATFTLLMTNYYQGSQASTFCTWSKIMPIPSSVILVLDHKAELPPTAHGTMKLQEDCSRTSLMFPHPSAGANSSLTSARESTFWGIQANQDTMRVPSDILP